MRAIRFLFLAFLVFSQALAATAEVKEKISSNRATLRIVIDGKELEINPVDRAPITSQIVTVFNSCSIDTSQDWLRELLEKDGATLIEQWNILQKESYFSLSYEQSSEVEKVLIAIENNRALGKTMAELESGEVKAYIKCSGFDLVKLYCMDSSKKYLPAAHIEGTDGYNCDVVKERE